MHILTCGHASVYMCCISVHERIHDFLSVIFANCMAVSIVDLNDRPGPRSALITLKLPEILVQVCEGRSTSSMACMAYNKHQSILVASGHRSEDSLFSSSQFQISDHHKGPSRGAARQQVMTARRLSMLFAALLGLVQLSHCSVLDSVLPGSCPVTPSKEKACCLLNAMQPVIRILWYSGDIIWCLSTSIALLGHRAS